MRSTSLFLAALLLAASLAGCAADETAPPATTPTPGTDTTMPDGQGELAVTYAQMGFDGTNTTTWPRLDGITLTILDHGAFGAFEDAKKLFENKTGAKLEHVEADDSGSALNRAVREKGDPTFDIIYGIDNILWTKAIEEGVFMPYEPVLSDRVNASYLFFNGTWHATPVDHGYIGLNVDETKLNATVASLDELKAHADQFVTEDPRTSTPGLGFLLSTIATYGEDGWRDYWADLFEGGVLITSGWTEAYEQHFSAGYGVDYGGAGDKPIVTSYTESPAYEHFFGRAPEALAKPLVVANSTFHQIQTMGIANGTKQLAAAQAWIEFTLTDEFQALAAPGNAVYPVVDSVSTDETYGDVDPAPGSFTPAQLDATTVGRNLEQWLREWTDLCEQHDCI